MTCRVYHLLGLSAFTALLCACTSLSPKDAFLGVRGNLEERIGRKIEWNQSTEEDQAARQAVRRLLEDDLTLDEAIQVALLNNLDLQGTYENLGIAQAALVQAGLLKNPVFAGSYKEVRHGGHVWELEVAQDFIDLLMLPLRRRIAKTALERTRLVVAGRVMDVVLEVKVAYSHLQADQQRLAMLRDILLAAEASYEMAHRLREAGNITELALLNERALFEETKVAVSAAELTVLESRERLNVLLGLWGAETQWAVRDPLPAIPQAALKADPLERRAIANSLDLAAARRGVDLAARSLNLTNVTSVIPEMEVGVDSEREGSGIWLVGPLLSFPVPLFDWGQARRAAARAELRRQWKRYTALAVEIRSAVRAALYRLRTVRQRVVYYDEVVLPLREKITHQTQLRYNGMLLGVFQLLQAKQAEIAVRQQYIDVLRDYWIAHNEMEQILNGRLVTGTAAAMSTTPAGAPMMRSGKEGH